MAIDPLVESHYVFSPAPATRAAVYDEISTGSVAARQAAGLLRDLPYGENERERLDLFPGREERPLVAFFHGGYWRSQHKDSYSFVATALREHGCSVAVVGYPLAPRWPLGRIIASCRSALRWLRGDGSHHLPAISQVIVAGHSAGGHLAACVANEAGVDVAGCLALSGLFDLRPLLNTSIGPSIGLDEATAVACSPIAQAPGRGWLIAAVGGTESEGFHRQTEAYVGHWPGAHHVEVPGADHYSILRELANPHGVVLRALGERLWA